MKKATTKLIDILTELSARSTPSKARDFLWAINVRYDYNKRVKYVIEHEGYLYDIADELSTSENEFYSFEDAETKLRQILGLWIENEIKHYEEVLSDFKENLKLGVIDSAPPFSEDELRYYKKELEKYGA